MPKLSFQRVLLRGLIASIIFESSALEYRPILKLLLVYWRKVPPRVPAHLIAGGSINQGVDATSLDP